MGFPAAGDTQWNRAARPSAQAQDVNRQLPGWSEKVSKEPRTTSQIPPSTGKFLPNRRVRTKDKHKVLKLPTGRAICYSGYRHGQNPGDQSYPSHEQILEDLLIMQPHWPLLRLYDCSLLGQRVLEVIRRESLPFQ